MTPMRAWMYDIAVTIALIGIYFLVIKTILGV